tara:strand:- start:1041 stop:1241 length:201 start_codon:yes stop_codon:yes gene_type:complete
MNKNTNIAKEYCANWWSGKCLGVMMSRPTGKLTTWIDSELQGKDCAADIKCNYFENIVVKCVSNEG